MTDALQLEIRTLRSLYESERDPEGRVFASLADAYRRAGKLDEAVKLVDQGLARHPDFVPGHVVAARLYADQGLGEEAGTAARRALELDAECVTALRALLEVLEKTGDEAEADRVRARLASLEPDFAAELAASGRLPWQEEAAEEEDAPDPNALPVPESEFIDVSRLDLGPLGEAPAGAAGGAYDPWPDEDAPDEPTLGAGEIAPLEGLETSESGLAGAGWDAAVRDEPDGVAGAFEPAASELPSSELPVSDPPTSEPPDSDRETWAEGAGPAEAPLDAGALDLSGVTILPPGAAPAAEGESEEGLAEPPPLPEVLFESDAGAGEEQPGEGDEAATDLPLLSFDEGDAGADPATMGAVEMEDAGARMGDLPLLSFDEGDRGLDDGLADAELAAPMEDEQEEEPVFGLDDPSWGGALASEPEPEIVPGEPVMDLPALAPDEEPALDVSALAPDEEPALDLPALAPDEEPALDVSALAPDEEPALDVSALAPDEEPALDVSALAPDEEPALDVSALAPDEEPALDVSALAPDEEPALDVSALAPDEEPALDVSALAPDEEPALDVSALAPDEEPALDVAALAPDDAEESLSPGRQDEIVIDMDAVGRGSSERGAEFVGAGAGDDADPPLYTGGSDGAGSGGEDDPGEPIYTRTLAELYVKQGAVGEALRVYRHLLERDPDDATLRARIRELEAGGADLQSQAARPAEPAPRPVPAPRPFEAAADEADEGGPAPAEGESIREYFESLLAWEPRDEP